MTLAVLLPVFPFVEKKGLATSANYVLRWYPKKTMSSVRPCMGKQRSGVLIRSERGRAVQADLVSST